MRVGIHTHNDCDMAVANSVAAVEGGASLVQGCVNGYGERTGNANILSVIGILQVRRCPPLDHPVRETRTAVGVVQPPLCLNSQTRQNSLPILPHCVALHPHGGILPP